MRAIVIDRYGGAEVLQRRDVPRPEPGPNEVLVRVAYAGVNFMDIGTRNGRYAQSQTYSVRLPCILGMEGAGEVVATGRAVTHLRAGHRVAWCIAWGSYAEYAAIPAALAAKLPDGIALDVAAAAMFQGCTAHYLVHDVARLKPGASVLVHAAAGGIGQIIVQMAKRSKATVFTTASTAEKREVAHRHGADCTLEYGQGHFADEVRGATEGQGVDVVFDSVGYATLRDSFRATCAHGLVINYGSVSGSVKDLNPLELGEAGSLFLTRPRLADHMSDGATVQRRANDIFGAICDGSLRVDISGRYTLDNVEQAHKRLEHRQQIGKAVLRL